MISIHEYMLGDYASMLDTARQSARDGSEFSQALLALAAKKLGKVDMARAAAEQVPKDSVLRRDPEAFFRRHSAAETVSVPLSEGLRSAFSELMRLQE